MSTINFVVRTRAGGSNHGVVSLDGDNALLDVTEAHEVSLNLRQNDIRGYQRHGQDLEITLADGRILVLKNYFAEAGGESRLFISADGYLNEVTLTDGGDGALYAQYGPTAEWGKWSPSDDLIFLGGSEVAAQAEEGEETVSMLGAAGLLGGSGLLGVGAAGAAAVAAGSAISGGGSDGAGGNGGPARIAPKIDQDSAITIGGDGTGAGSSEIVISGEADPGSRVEVSIGDKTLETISGDDGKWKVTFEGDDFPGDGDHTVKVIVTEPDGTVSDLTGPGVAIDTTAPDVTVTEGTAAQGEITNAEEFDAGFDLAGTGEAGASVAVTIQGVTRETVVAEDGTWRVTFEGGTLERGEYDSTVTVVSRDAAGNSTTITETVRIDTVANEVGIATGTIAGDGVVNGTEMAGGVDITGTATPGATIVVTVEGVELTVTADGDGNWVATYESGSLRSGQYEAAVSAVTTDLAGNVNSTSGTIRIDTFVENFGITSSTGGADGVINAAEATSGLIVTGSGEPGSSVSVKLANATVQADVAADGSWSAAFAAAQIPPGTYVTDMVATATDAAGNTSTVTRAVSVDTEAGTLTLDAERIGGDGTINHAEMQAGVAVTGTADAGAVVTVTLDGVTHQAVADGNGVWRTTYQAGEVSSGVRLADVRASVRDAAGNMADVTGSVQIDTQVDNLSLTPPRLGMTADGRTLVNQANSDAGFDISGTAEPGSVVTVTIAGVSRSATVAANGDWSATFAKGSIPGGEYDTTLRVDVTDPAGNTDSIGEAMRVDTLVNALSRGGAPIEGDNVVNVAEALDGVTLSGQVEPGSGVRVDVLGKSYAASVAANGAWTLDIPASDIPRAEQDFAMTVTATDAAGNTRTMNDTISIDTIAPDQPDIVGYFREGGGYRSVTLETADDPVTIHKVAASGTVSELALHESPDPFLGETGYHFLDGAGKATRIPDGSQLVVTTSDAAGNASSTYLVLDETSTSVVNVTNPNLSGFQIDAIDLRFGDQSQLTLTEAQIRALSDSSDTVVVHGASDDSVTISGAQQGGKTLVDGESHTIYTLGTDGATIVIDDDINVII